ncbi:uncharacterized protein B0H64DRAFT_437520 [Chaetomium fimeti]|uniref:FAD-binding domain-containing protein n=1 Tax=Chaetomium fimeti TaxID=1854472 RepID=A0AAE0HPP1_9PEZI|nr:hypothetical protein B0H64DRAFT_437520 [Chaetomium fimeti]
MRDAMKSDELDEERDRWVDSLDDAEICRLASSFHHGDPCTIFRPRKRGGFNICFFVQFESPQLERWVVRIPIPAMVTKAVLDEKTEIELATMRYVSAKTTIPIPKVHAYAFSDTGLNGLPFIIMDFVDGQSLKDHGFKAGQTWGEALFLGPQTPAAKVVHQQLADIYVQLRQLEFPKIGALGLSSRDVSALSCGPEEISVCHRPLSIEISDQELDGLEPGELDKERDQGMDDNEPASILYAAHHFKHFIQNEWLDQSANEGPFVLVHGDMDIVIGDILFDNDYKLVGVLDWEWSRVVPVQLMMPPIWLTAGNLQWVLLMDETYNKQVGYVRAAVQEREKELGIPPLLSTEWAPLEKWYVIVPLATAEKLRFFPNPHPAQNPRLWVVMDKYNIIGDTGAAIHLCPNVTRILPRWGIKMENLSPNSMSRYVERARGGDIIRDVDLAESNARWVYPRYMVHRSTLQRELIRVATLTEGDGEPVSLVAKKRVTEVDPEAGVYVENSTLVSADVIIGADGISSATRETIKKVPLVRTGKAAFRFIIAACAAESDPETASLVSQKDTLTIWFADDRRIVMYPCENSEWLNFVCIYPDEESQAIPTKDWSGEASRDHVLHVFRDFDKALLALFRKANKKTIRVWQLLDMEALPTWTSSRLALMGDAAHPCLPYQAQGGAQAIEDAAALAAVLPKGTDPIDVPERLKMYEKIRYERATRIQEYSRLTGQDWIAGKPARDMREFETYNFDHDEIENSASAFKSWVEVEWRSLTVTPPEEEVPSLVSTPPGGEEERSSSLAPGGGKERSLILTPPGEEKKRSLVLTPPAEGEVP